MMFMSNEEVSEAIIALDRWLKSQEIEDIEAWRVLLGMLIKVIARTWSVEQYSRIEAELTKRIHEGLEFYRKARIK